MIYKIHIPFKYRHFAITVLVERTGAHLSSEKKSMHSPTFVHLVSEIVRSVQEVFI